MKKALTEAANSPDEFQVGAVITDKRGQVIASANNRMTKTHPIQAYYAQRADACEKIYLHAEIAALIRCKTEPYTVYVGRVLKDGSAGTSRPCEVCQLAIKEAGTRYIVYVDSKGAEVMEAVW
jgi:tRNA(Arg) A34 adenosine deaminase TadA